MHGVGGRDLRAPADRRFTRLEIAGEPRMRAADDQDAQARAHAEAVSHRVEFEPHGAVLTRQAPEPVGHVAGAAFPVHFGQPNEQVAVRVVARVREFDHGRCDHAEVRGQRVAGEGEHVVAFGQPPIGEVAGLRGQQPAADGRGGIGRIEREHRRRCGRMIRWHRGQLAGGAQNSRYSGIGGGQSARSCHRRC